MGLDHFLEGSRLAGMAIMESPEVQTRARRRAAQKSASAELR
jgi:hypothetical protein